MAVTIGSGAYRVGPLARALEVLELLGNSERSMSLAELSSSLQMPKSSVFKYLRSLMAEGFVVQSWETEQYSVGPAVMCIWNEDHQWSWLRMLTRDRLVALRDEIGDTVVLTVMDPVDRAFVTVLDAAPASWPLRVVMEVGDRAPVQVSAAGRAILATLPERWRGLHRPHRLERFTAATVTDESEFAEILTTTAERGYAVERGEWMSDVTSVAAPILGDDRTPIAAITVVGPTARLAADAVSDAGLLLATAVAGVTSELGRTGRQHPAATTGAPRA